LDSNFAVSSPAINGFFPDITRNFHYGFCYAFVTAEYSLAADESMSRPSNGINRRYEAYFLKNGCWLFVLLTALSSQRLLAIETQYITEALTVSLHGGKSKQHRFIGALKAGDPVTILTVDQENSLRRSRIEKGVLPG
jgi:hypothetical protein